MSASLETQNFDHAVKLPRVPFKINFAFRDVCAYADYDYSGDEYHFVERNHWCNGYMPGSGEYSIREDSVEVSDFWFEIPFLTRLVGPHLADSICEWVWGKFNDDLADELTELLNVETYDFEWCYD